MRDLKIEDLELGALASLDNLVPGTSLLDLDKAKGLVREMQSNPLHRLFAAVSLNAGEETVVGTTTLLVEPKLIFTGGRVGHVEDVSVRKGFEKQGIGRRLVEHAEQVAVELGCVKLVLDCSDANRIFYEKMGYAYQDNFMNKFLKNPSGQ